MGKRKEVKIIWPEIKPDVLANAIVKTVVNKLAEYSPEDQVKMYQELLSSVRE